ncbi:UNVERIFIED_CONTAM: hypothetical protein PYX00_007355 [Menopon gallinae]|uniref:Tubulin--tyrosine ligase-like protein 12 SET-like domain-containing protein n=1 Tax=Menopon gallinae TaxID=328185 RepID=A0AAW2HJN4_9NEOP
MEEKDGLVEYNIFMTRHKLQLERSSVPEKFWFTLHKKLEKGIFDAGESFAIYKIDYEDNKLESDPLYTVLVSKEDGIRCDDREQIYLVDHAWTYSYNNAVENLTQIPGLLTRMCNLMGVADELPDEEKVEKVCDEMWKYNQTYSYGFGDAENRVPIWYIMDEFGSAIQHSINPNFRAVPFYYWRDQISYTLLFPIKDLEVNEKVTRNYLEGSLTSDELTNKAFLIPWEPISLTHVDFTQADVDGNFHLHGHTEETLPETDDVQNAQQQGPLKVYSEYSVLIENLTDPNFQIVTNEDDADILWLNEHFKKYKELNETHPEKFINQFPYEHVLTVKDLLSNICRRKRGGDAQCFRDDPPWCPVTFNLNKNIEKFVSYYQNREKSGLDNHWICKPWNLARGLDIVVTKNLNCILRLPSTGPKIAQKYVERPVLFMRPDVGWVKFDIRYVVLLKSVKPIRMYAYKNFFLRFANKPFEMTELWDDQKHFTVMNYNENAVLYKMLCSDFVVEFNGQNPETSWNAIEKEIFHALKEIAEAATMKPPPCGIGHYSKSRAIYAVDLILAWETAEDGSERIQPKILEFNWNPDCKRACEYYPTFFNDVFLNLFKDVENEDLFQEL